MIVVHMLKALRSQKSHLVRRMSNQTVPIPGGDKPGLGKTVAVAMSGGIDSAVAALLLQDQGYNCVGVFMKNWDPADECGSATCDISADVIDMRQVCKRLNIPSYEVDFVKEYWNEVFTPFLDAYQTGVETPNPDAFCNRFVKFNHFRKFVTNKLGIDTIATGHYARMVPSQETSTPNGIVVTSDSSGTSRGTQMLRGLDPLKDQTYFLALTKGEALQKVLFPVGHLPKAEVKAIASRRLAGLNVLTKHESMGICFIGKRDMKDFLKDYITLTKGRFIDLDTGAVVGQHDSFEYYTIGQKASIANFNAKYYVMGRKKNVVAVPVKESKATKKINKRNPGDSAVTSTEDSSAAATLPPPTTHTTTTPTPTSTPTMPATEVSGDVYVVNDLFHPALFTPYIIQPLSGINWFAGGPPKALLDTLTLSDGAHSTPSSEKKRLFRCEVKCRYSQLPTGCTMELVLNPGLLAFHNNHYNVIHSNLSGAPLNDNGVDLKNVMIKIVFDVPQRAITPGQILAIYENEVVLGGAVIAVQPLYLANGELLML